MTNTSDLAAQADIDSQARTPTTAPDTPVRKSKRAPAVEAAPPSKARVARQPTAKKAKTPQAAAPAARKAPKAVVKRPAKPKALADDKAQKVKTKLIRDSFTMPQADFELIDMLKQRALDFRHSAKKSELLRAGLQALVALPQSQLQAALERITPLKPGRPKKID